MNNFDIREVRADRDKFRAMLQEICDAEERFESDTGIPLIDEIADAVRKARTMLEVKP